MVYGGVKGLFLPFRFAVGDASAGSIFGCLDGFAHLLLYLGAEVGILFKQLLDGITTLANLLLAIREPRAGLLDNAVVDTQVENLANL